MIHPGGYAIGKEKAVSRAAVKIRTFTDWLLSKMAVVFRMAESLLVQIDIAIANLRAKIASGQPCDEEQCKLNDLLAERAIIIEEIAAHPVIES